MRTYDVALITEAVGRYGAPVVGFDPDAWAHGANIALTNDKRDVTLFEYTSPGKYTPHVFYVSRGKEALQVARDALAEVFSDKYRVEVLTGLTPLHKKGARWLTRQVGFTSYGTVETQIGPCEIFILTKKEWEKI